MTKPTDKFSQFTEPLTCREYTLPRDKKSSDPKGWIRGNTKIGPVLEVTTIYQQRKCACNRDVLENHLKNRSFRLVHLVEYYPVSAKDQSRIHQFGKKVLPGLFLGYALYAGRMWKGDVLIADLEELETMDASKIYSKRLNAKEVIFPRENGKFYCPIADGRIKLPGGDQDLRTSTLIREHPIRGENHLDFLGEIEKSLPTS